MGMGSPHQLGLLRKLSECECSTVSQTTTSFINNHLILKLARFDLRTAYGASLVVAEPLENAVAMEAMPTLQNTGHALYFVQADATLGLLSLQCH
jgi:hypothetical protein